MTPLLLHAQTEAPATPPARVEQSGIEERREALEDDRRALEERAQELEHLRERITARLQDASVTNVTPADAEQAGAEADITRLQHEEVTLDVAAAERRIRDLEQAIRDHEAQIQFLRNPATAGPDPGERAARLDVLSGELAARQQQLALEREHLELLNTRLEQERGRLELQTGLSQRLQELVAEQQIAERRQQEEVARQRVLSERQERRAELDALQRQLAEHGDSMGEMPRRLLTGRINVLEGRSRLEQVDLLMGTAEGDIQALESLLARETVQLADLDAGLRRLQEIGEELVSHQGFFDRAATIARDQRRQLEQDLTLVTGEEAAARGELLNLLAEVIRELETRRARLYRIHARVGTLSSALGARTADTQRSALLARAQLPGDLAGWRNLGARIVATPWFLLQQARVSAGSVIRAMLESGALVWPALLGLQALLWTGVLWSRQRLGQIRRRPAEPDDSFLGVVLKLMVRLLHRNLLGIGVVGSILLMLWMFPVPQPGLGIVITLSLLWLAIKLPVNLAWMLFGHPALPEGQRHPRLCRQLSLSLAMGGVLVAVLVTARLSAVEPDVIDVFDRLFMLWQIAVALPLLRMRGLLLEAMGERFAGQFGYVALGVVSLLFVLSLLGAGIVGIAGYLTLAWAINWHQLIFLLVVLGWLALRGLVADGANGLRRIVANRSENALLWIQEVIAPLERIVQVALIIGMWPLLLALYGMEGDSTVLRGIRGVLETPLFTVGETPLTLWRILITVFAFLMVIWFAQWCRAVAYRWVFSRIIDLGIRHSLSVFTQYFVVVVGVLIALRVIGLDLTTMAVFAGALGVGIGFGMQNIANNFVSGVLLLVERPLRSGDTVQIGEHLGLIQRIGIRSLTVRTFDNMDVIIPNSDVISGSFVNWSHSDNVVRTVLMIGASYDADPEAVLALLEKVVNAEKDVVREPSPLVTLHEFGDSAVIFRVHYYIDFERSSLLDVRSKVLFAIWREFRLAGIGIPYPQRELHIKDWPPAAPAEIGP